MFISQPAVSYSMILTFTVCSFPEKWPLSLQTQYLQPHLWLLQGGLLPATKKELFWLSRWVTWLNINYIIYNNKYKNVFLHLYMCMYYQAILDLEIYNRCSRCVLLQKLFRLTKYYEWGKHQWLTCQDTYLQVKPDLIEHHSMGWLCFHLEIVTTSSPVTERLPVWRGRGHWTGVWWYDWTVSVSEKCGWTHLYWVSSKHLYTRTQFCFPTRYWAETWSPMLKDALEYLMEIPKIFNGTRLSIIHL